MRCVSCHRNIYRTKFDRLELFPQSFLTVGGSLSIQILTCNRSFLTALYCCPPHNRNSRGLMKIRRWLLSIDPVRRFYSCFGC